MPDMGHNSMPSQTEILLDSLGLPAFLLDVEGERQFRFRFINSQHCDETGIDGSGLAGQCPHDVLPARMADTVVSNYEACRASSAVFRYDEMLDLPSGVKWWSTALSPIKDADGNVSQIIGIATDVTAAKDLEMRTSNLQELTDYIRSFASHAAYDEAGPLKMILDLLGDIKTGFKDLGDNKFEQLVLCEQTALQAIDESTAILSVADALTETDADYEQLDLGHICRDIIAVIDPDQRRQIIVPEAVVQTDWACLLTALRAFLTEAVSMAETSIELSFAGSINGMLQFELKDDRSNARERAEHLGPHDKVDSDAVGTSGDVEAAMELLRFNGGNASYDIGTDGGACIAFAMPGHVDAAAAA